MVRFCQPLSKSKVQNFKENFKTSSCRNEYFINNICNFKKVLGENESKFLLNIFSKIFLSYKLFAERRKLIFFFGYISTKFFLKLSECLVKRKLYFITQSMRP